MTFTYPTPTTIDMDYMMELSGKSENEILEDLKGVIFLNPLYEYGNSYEPKYLMADEYLSGNVREKLKICLLYTSCEEQRTLSRKIRGQGNYCTLRNGSEWRNTYG